MDPQLQFNKRNSLRISVDGFQWAGLVEMKQLVATTTNRNPFIRTVQNKQIKMELWRWSLWFKVETSHISWKEEFIKDKWQVGMDQNEITTAWKVLWEYYGYLIIKKKLN